MEKVILRLFIAGTEQSSLTAIKNLEKIRKMVLHPNDEVEIIDILEAPEQAEKSNIIATPTLIREEPKPAVRVIGDLSDMEMVITFMQLKREE